MPTRKRNWGSLVLFFLGLYLPAGGGASDELRCSEKFNRFFQKVNPEKLAAGLQRLEELDAINVQDIFKSYVKKRGSGQLVEVTADNRQIYQRAFDDFWDTMVDTGKVPSEEIFAYRRWLKKKYNGRPYPEINREELYREFVAQDPPGKLTDYFGDRFLDYLTTREFSSIESYVESMDPSLVRRLGKRAMRTYHKTKNFIWGGAVTAFFLQFNTIPVELVTNAINGFTQAFFGQTLKEWLNSNAKEKSAQLVETVKDWSSLFAGGEEQYVSTILALKMASANLEGRKFESRQEARDELEKFMASTSQRLPLFHKLVLSEQANFDTYWLSRLQELRQPMMAVNNGYQQYKIALDQKQTEISARARATPEEEIETERLEATLSQYARIAGARPLTLEEQELEKSAQDRLFKMQARIQTRSLPLPEESDQMAQYQEEISGAESFLASALADWLFYKQTRGPDSPLDPALERNFNTIYDSYLRLMSPGKLAEAINARVKAHISQLEQYSKKAVWKKGEPPTAPVKKPEDQIAEEAGPTAGTESKSPAPRP